MSRINSAVVNNVYINHHKRTQIIGSNWISDNVLKNRGKIGTKRDIYMINVLSTKYYDEWTSFANLAMGTQVPDFDGLKHYLGVLHMGDHIVLLVKAWYKLTWGFVHRHLGVILRYLFQGFRYLSLYVGYETLFHVYLHGVYKKWSGQETTEACDWVIGTHISDKWRLYAFGLIDISVCC